jgi:hypothetical protein
MKKQLQTIMIAATLALTAADTSHAMSELISLSTDPMWPASSTPDNNVVYYVTTVGRGGAGLLEVSLAASDMPPGVTVTFSPSVLRFTGTKVTSQTATMTVHCPSLMPIDCHSFTLTGTALRERVTITNQVMFTREYVAARPSNLYLDNWGNGQLRLRGLGATGRTYQIEAKENTADAIWKPLGYSTADGNGRFTFFTGTVTGVPVCYYRAVVPASDATPQE